MKSNKIKGLIFGFAVGDALGVPVEFNSRMYLANNPLIDMMEYGSHNQPKGTWSDDSSLTFCLIEMLCEGYNIDKLANRFLNWRNYGYWAAHGEVFDIGIATNLAIQNIENGTPPLLAGAYSEMDNGNGSLMRILPLVFYIKDFNVEKRFDIIKEVSSVTHRHIRSILACFIYLEYARCLLNNETKEESFYKMRKTINDFLNLNPICSQKEMDIFHRVLGNKKDNYETINFLELTENEINSSGYVLDTLEASLWCFLTTETYKDAVLKAVNLGKDTDTTACVTGGLAGLYYGYEQIPNEWIQVLAKKEDIEKLCNKFAMKYDN